MPSSRSFLLTVALAGFLTVAAPSHLTGCARSSALPDKPPPVEVSTQTGAATGLVAACSWPGPAGRRDETWPPTLPAGALVVEPGRELTLSLPGVTQPPDQVVMNLFPRPDFARVGGPGEAVDTSTVTRFGVDGETPDTEARVAPGTVARVSWTYTVPGSAAPRPERGEGRAAYVLWVKSSWKRGAWSVSYVSLEVVSPGSLGLGGKLGRAAVDTARAFFEAAWAGSRAGAQALLTEEVLADRVTFADAAAASCSYLFATEYAPWDVLLWRDSRRTFSLSSGPTLNLEGYVADSDGGTAEVSVSYQVQVSEKGTPVVRHDFAESYRLVSADGQWRVTALTRTGVPYLAAGGNEPGWLPTVRAAGDRVICGPFSDVALWSAVWDPSGERLAFRAGNFGRTEVWVVDAAQRQGRAVLTIADKASQGLEPVDLVGWTADGQRLVLLEPGQRQDAAGGMEDGLWVRTVSTGPPAVSGDTDTGSASGESAPADVAFIPTSLHFYRSPPTLTSDQKAVFLHLGPKLVRVDLADGRVTTSVTDFPDYDGLFAVWFSPHGWAAQWHLWGPDGPAVVLMDLQTESKLTIGRRDGVGWACSVGWSPDGLAAVGEARRQDVNPGDDFEYPGGFTALNLYDRSGTLRYRLEPPGGTDRRIGDWAWSTDGTALLFACGPMVTDSEPNPITGNLDRVARADELWVWEKASNTLTKLADLELETSAYLTWPAASLVCLFPGPSGQQPPIHYDLTRPSAGQGLWKAVRRQWPDTPPPEVLGESGGNLVIVTSSERERGRRLALDGQAGRTVLAEGALSFEADAVANGYVVFTDESEAAKRQLYLVVEKLPESSAPIP